MANVLDEWITELAAALGVDPEVVDRDVLLDVARDAAHGIARPAAPLTTFLIGFAAARGNADADAVRRAAGVATDLATRHTAAD